MKDNIKMLGVATKYRFYRTYTALHAFWVLYSLPPAKLKAFFESYGVFDPNWKEQKYDQGVRDRLVNYYSVLNYLCAIGHVEKMYIPPALDLNKSFLANQDLFEAKMAKDLSIKQGDRVLDVGCGRGRIASNVATLTGANLTGMNIDEVQLKSAREFAEAKGLSERCEFKRGDMNQLTYDFTDQTFDAIYEVQAFSYAADMPKIFRELYRLLKPGGKVSCYDFVLKEGFDPNNAHHADLLRRLKPLVGAIGAPKVSDFVDAMTQAGFKIIINEDISLNAQQAPIIESVHGWYTSVGKWIGRLSRLKVLPAHFEKLFNRLSQDGDALIEAVQLDILTTSWHIVAQKT